MGSLPSVTSTIFRTMAVGVTGYSTLRNNETIITEHVYKPRSCSEMKRS